MNEIRNSQHLVDILVTIMTVESKAFGNKLLNRHKEQAWSQFKLGKQVNTSGAIIGWYERSEKTPSIEATKKLAMLFV